MLLIGISAKAGCGKTTMAEVLVTDYGFTRVAVADALKEECAKFTGLGLEYFNVPELKETTVTVPFGRIIPRKFMQIWGTEFRRAESPNYWLARLWEKILLLQARGVKRFVVDDIRFTNEAFFIRQHGGILVRLDPYEGYKNAAGTHKSETELDYFQEWSFRFAPEYGKIKEQAVEPLIHGLIDLQRQYVSNYVGAVCAIRAKEAADGQE